MDKKNIAEKKNSGAVTVSRFRLIYVILPVSVLVLSLILIAVFYGKLPASVYWSFREEGLPDEWANKTGLVITIAGLQLGLTLVSAVITLGVTLLFNRFVQPGSSVVSPDSITALMGNMIALPQVVILFATLDIFSYNSYGIHLLPLWLNAVIVLLTGGIILGIFFLRALIMVWRAYKE